MHGISIHLSASKALQEIFMIHQSANEVESSFNNSFLKHRVKAVIIF